MLIIMLLWLSLLNAHQADRWVDRLAGPQNEYGIVLGSGLAAAVLAFVAAIRGAKWWYVAVALSLGTLGFYVFALSR